MLLGCVLITLLVPASSPLWLPWVLPAGLRWWGVTIASAERLGRERIVLRDASYSRQRVTIQAGRIELLQPVAYVVRRLGGTSFSLARPGLVVSDWTVTAAARHDPAGPKTGSTGDLLDGIAAILDRCRQHLPAARLERGRVLMGNQGVELREVTWNGARVESAGQCRGNEFTLAVDAEAASALRIQAASKVGSVDLQLQALAPGRWTAKGSARAFDHELDLEAAFGRDGWLPHEAVARVENLRWPESLAPRPQVLERVGGSAALRWQDGHGRLEAAVQSSFALPATVFPPQGNAAPARWDEAAPSQPQHVPFTARFLAEFDPTQASVTQLSVTSRLAQATLAQPIHLSWEDLPGVPAGALNLTADLNEVDPERLEGRVEGTLRFAPRLGNAVPAFDLDLAANGVSLDGSPPGEVSLHGSIVWPIARLETLNAKWPECQLEAGGEFDLVGREFRNGRWQLDGVPPLPFPAGAALGKTHARGSVEGPLTALRHGTELTAEGIEAGFHEPLALHATVAGIGTSIESFAGRINAGPLELAVGGSARLSGSSSGNAMVELTRLDWRRGNLERLRLRQPTQLRWELHSGRATNQADGSLRFELAPLILEGSEALIQVSGSSDWPQTGVLGVELIRPPLDDLATVLREIPDWLTVNSLEAQVGWTNGPITGQARTAVTLQLNRRERARLDAELELAPDRLTSRLTIAKDTGERLARSEIAIPVGWELGASKVHTRVNPEGSVHATLTATSSPALWHPLASHLGVSVEDPSLEVTLGGNLRRLHGDVHLGAASVTVNRKVGGKAVPPLEALDARIVLAESGALRAEIEAGAAGQRAQAALELPMPPLDLERLANVPVPDWSDARGHVRLSRWQIEALLPWLPELLAPEGELDAEVNLEPGRQLAGTFHVTGAETLALPGLGPLRQMQLIGDLHPGAVRLTTGTAELGGRRISFSGSYAFATNVSPRMRFDFAGTNLTLIRNADVVLRGDARLSLTGETLEDAEIAGDLRFHNSLLLRDLQTLVGGRAQTPENRPPWFSIRQAPFASWRLNVRVAGHRFLRVVTPLFRGWASTSLALAGTLGEPLLLGDVTVPEGRLTFPFGSLAVTQARASLTREDPHRPRLQVKASGRNFGYDLRLDISGPADAMNLVFGSVPPLSSTQVLLMLTTGEVPSEAYSYSATRRLQTIGLFLGKEFLGQLAGDPGAERLTLRTGEDITHRGQLTYRIEYQLTPRWSLFGTQDRFDSYQGGVIYTLYAK